jgi:hypothetical protein
MMIFDVQNIEIKESVSKVFDYIANPNNLPAWTSAFKKVQNGYAVLQTPNGSIEITLKVNTSKAHGTIDWIMIFPDGSLSTAYSRVVDSGKGSSIYSFVILAPPVSLEKIEGALQQQTKILREELLSLSKILEKS